MKRKLFPFTLITLLILLASCSSKLNESTIKNILSESLSKEDLQATEEIRIGAISYLKEDDLTTYKKLEAEGMLSIEENTAKRSHTISLSDKASEYVLETKKKSVGLWGNTATYAKIRVCNLSVGNIEDIHEVPAENTATARVTLNKVDKTPFYLLVEDKTDFKKVKLSFFKTTDNEWKLLTKK